MSDMTPAALIFRGHAHDVIRREDGNYLSLNQLCRFMGLDGEGQRQAVLRKRWSEGRTCKTQAQLSGDRQSREQFLLHERIVPMWLANISTRHIRDRVVRGIVEQYQIEFADALYEYVANGGAINSRATDAQLDRLESEIKVLRLQERQDYKNILTALKAGGAVSGDDYRHVQNTLYLGLFGKTAAQIRATQDQRGGEEYKRKPGVLKPSSVAKDYLTEDQLTLLNAAVLASTAQLQARYPRGASVAQMVAVVNASVGLVKPRQVA